MATRWFTSPEEVATFVAMLASPRTANVTGSNYVIDGGLVKTNVMIASRARSGLPGNW
jgi:NAD(P)-dependent dehydrogenase (short-subunit alcohol dehydrogenase family)